MDEIITIGRSLVQHGKHNDRAYILSFSEEDDSATLDMIEQLARKNGYTKIVAKVPEMQADIFTDMSFAKEGRLENCEYERFYFMSKYLSDRRKQVDNLEELESVINSALTAEPKDIKETFEIRPLTKDDIDPQIAIYKTVFKTYPFPIYYREFIEEMMDSHVSYYGVFEDGKMIATASAELDEKTGLAEMTDFATLPEHRGKGFAVKLLEKMEEDLEKRGIRSYFTIARAVSHGMNKTFARCGYTYSGTLYNNTNINGDIESMNIWYKVV
ncbi:MAG: putative beta-lysine N-acetyltransferase [Deferribacterales bacterium]